MLLPEGHTRKFNGKSRIPWLKKAAGKQRPAGFFQAIEMGKRHAVVVLKIGGAAWNAFQKGSQFGPALSLKELLRGGSRGLRGGLF